MKKAKKAHREVFGALAALVVGLLFMGVAAASEAPPASAVAAGVAPMATTCDHDMIDE